MSGSDDHLSKQQTYYKHISPESDLESCGACVMKPAKGRPYKSKGRSDKATLL